MHPGGVRSAMHLFNFEKSANLKHPNAYPSDTLVCQMDGDEGAFWHMARVPKGKIKIPKGLHLDVYDITKGVFQYKDTRSSCSWSSMKSAKLAYIHYLLVIHMTLPWTSLTLYVTFFSYNLTYERIKFCKKKDDAFSSCWGLLDLKFDYKNKDHHHFRRKIWRICFGGGEQTKASSAFTLYYSPPNAWWYCYIIIVTIIIIVVMIIIIIVIINVTTLHRHHHHRG